MDWQNKEYPSLDKVKNLRIMCLVWALCGSLKMAPMSCAEADHAKAAPKTSNALEDTFIVGGYSLSVRGACVCMLVLCLLGLDCVLTKSLTAVS